MGFDEHVWDPKNTFSVGDGLFRKILIPLCLFLLQAYHFSLTKSLPLSHSLPSFFPFLLFLLPLHLSSGSLCSASNRLLHPLPLTCYLSDDHLKKSQLVMSAEASCSNYAMEFFEPFQPYLCSSQPGLLQSPVSLGARLFLSPSHHY